MRVLTCLLLLLLSSPGATLKHFRYVRRLSIPPGNGQACTTLDAGVFLHSAPDQADLRLVVDGHQQPYVLEPVGGATPAPRTLPVLNLGRSAAGSGPISFDVHMPRGTYSSVKLLLNAQNFVGRVRVVGERQGRSTLLGTYTIFDLSREELGRGTTLHLPLSNFSRLHFELSGAVRPAQVTGVEVSGGPATVTGTPLVVATHARRTGRQTVFELNVPAGVSIDSIEFQAPAAASNFARNVDAEVTPLDRKVEPQPLGQVSGMIERIHLVRQGRPVEAEQLSIPVNLGTLPTPSRWRVVIHNGDDRPLVPASVALTTYSQELCFSGVSGSAKGHLYYGNSRARAPVYDLVHWWQRDAHVREALLGPEQRNPGYVAPADRRQWSERHPALLWLGMLVAALGLGWVVFRTARRATTN